MAVNRGVLLASVMMVCLACGRVGYQGSAGTEDASALDGAGSDGGVPDDRTPPPGDGDTPVGVAVEFEFPAPNTRVTTHRSVALPVGGRCEHPGVDVVFSTPEASTRCDAEGLWQTTVDVSGFDDGPLILVANQSPPGGPSHLPATHPIVLDAAFCADATNFTASPFAGGSGTDVDPFLICSPDQLDAVRTALGAAFLLRNDIDLETLDVPFLPIGDTTTPFTGRLDGDSLRIYALKVSGDDDVGMFGRLEGTVVDVSFFGAAVDGLVGVGVLAGTTEGATIERVTADATVIGTQWVGGLVGHGLSGTTMRQVKVIGTVQGMDRTGGVAGRLFGQMSDSFAETEVEGDQHTGGLVGELLGLVERTSASGTVLGTLRTGGAFGTVSGDAIDCASDAAVFGGSSSGGFVGQVDGGGTIARCSAIGAVMAGDYSGGFAGPVDGTVTDSYSTGAVQGGQTVGGFAALTNSDPSNQGILTNCYAIGRVTGTTNTGGLIGARWGVIPADAVSSYWSIDGTQATTSAGTTEVGLTDSQMLQQASFVGWDFATVWIMPGVADLEPGPPILRNSPMTS